MSSEQRSFDFTRPVLPLPERLPTNVERTKVRNLVREDFTASTDYLIITGFSSLEFILGFFRNEGNEKQGVTRILLGHEDLKTGTVRNLKGNRLDQEIIDFWIERGFSVSQYSGVLNLIDLIENKQVDFRILQGLHAKIYLGEQRAILGSSNFSYNGLQRQLEANLRIDKEKEEDRYTEIRQVGEYYWERGKPFNAQILKLLRELLGKVSWRQALARAAALLIEREWWKSFRNMQLALQGFTI